MAKKTTSKLLQTMHDDLLVLKTDMIWLKRLIVGAASLGFVEKLIGWLVGH